MPRLPAEVTAEPFGIVGQYLDLCVITFQLHKLALPLSPARIADFFLRLLQVFFLARLGR